MKSLISQIEPISALSDELKRELFDLYSCYYAGTNNTIFQQDLIKKNWIILLYDAKKQVQGFSTLALFNHTDATQTVSVLYSGDTIINKKYWGQHELAVSWLHFAGQIKAKHPTIPLYWFLIVKGYRTYRYLSAFSCSYYPSPVHKTPIELQMLLEALALDRFGSDYDKEKGIVRFANSRGYLKDAWAEVPEKVKSRADVQFFLQRNPEFYKGDELVCLCELSQDNLKPFSRRVFMTGFQCELDKSA